jgi:hypothetical protein
MELIAIFAVVIIAIFIFSKFKKFENRKLEIINALANHGYKSAEAISIYDTNHYEISKMISAGFSVQEIASRYSEKYSRLLENTSKSENSKDTRSDLDTQIKETNIDENSGEVEGKLFQTDKISEYADDIYKSLSQELHRNDVSQDEAPLEIEYGYILGYVDGYLQCRKELDDALHFGLVTFVLMKCFNIMTVAPQLIKKFEKLEEIMTPDIMEGLKIGMADAKIIFENPDAKILGLTNALNE